MIKSERGNILLIALFIIGIILTTVLLVVGGAQLYHVNTQNSVKTEQAVALAEAGVDKAISALNETGGSYNGETGIQVGNGQINIAITNKDVSTKVITATAYVPNEENAQSTKTVSLEVSSGAGLSFNYALQSGEGGFTIDGGSSINGSVFSNSDILLSGGGRITGDAQVAGGTQAAADQQTDCVSPYCADFQFGRSVGGNNQLDIAQSFQPSATTVVNKVYVKLKKYANPPNLTLRILANNNGSPNKNNVLASGTLNASLVTTSYGFAEVSLTTTPTLTANTLYWIVLDTSADNTNYWAWSNDLAMSYTRGSAKWSPNWNANGTPTWNNISGDLGFQVYMGGVITRIAGTGSGFVDGNAYANTLTANVSTGLVIGQHAYYQNQSGITVHGSSCTSNSYCHPGSTDPASKSMPISQANITEWKDAADDVVQTGNQVFQWPCTAVLEKKKYIGNVTIQGGCTIQADSPVWITGNLTVTGGSILKLKSSYGGNSGIIVVDGTINLNGGSKIEGSGTTGSYVLALSTYNSHTLPAISVAGGNHSSIIYAGDGIISLSGGVNIRQATAWRITATGGSIITYESGVTDPTFSTGAAASYGIVKGTYQVK